MKTVQQIAPLRPARELHPHRSHLFALLPTSSPSSIVALLRSPPPSQPSSPRKNTETVSQLRGEGNSKTPIQQTLRPNAANGGTSQVKRMRPTSSRTHLEPLTIQDFPQISIPLTTAKNNPTLIQDWPESLAPITTTLLGEQDKDKLTKKTTKEENESSGSSEPVDEEVEVEKISHLRAKREGKQPIVEDDISQKGRKLR